MSDEERRQAGGPEEVSENATGSGEPDLPAELPDLPAELEEALREKDQFRSLAQRVTADLENYKRRAAEEREELRRFGQSQLILKLLGVSDDFQRAMDMVPEGAIAPGWREGLDLVQRGIDHLLESEGVTAIEAEGEPFEPSEHEAVAFQETTELEAGRVLSVIRPGYKKNGRVLRAAQVTVSKAP